MEKKYENKKEIRRIRWLIFGVALSLLASDIIYQAVVSFMSSPPHDYIRTVTVEIAAFLLPFLIYGLSRSEKLSAGELRLNGFGAEKAVYVVLLGITGQFVMMLLNLPLEYAFQKFLKIGSETSVYTPQSISAILGGIFAIGILPAFLEEFCIRGLLFSVYNRISTKAAFWFSVIIFALLHGKPEELPGYIFMGAMSAFILLRCNSLYASIVYHITSNLTALIFSLTVMKIIPWLWFLFAFAGILFILLFIRFYAKFPPVGTVKGKREKKLFWGSVFSLPVILSIGIVILRYWLLNIRA